MVKEMLEAGADHIFWMLYYDLTPAEVDIARFGREYVGALPGAYAKAVILQLLPETKVVKLLDPFFHDQGKQIRADLNSAIVGGVMGAGLSPDQLKKVSLVPA